MIDFLQHHPACPDDLEICIDVQEPPQIRTLSEAEGHKHEAPNPPKPYFERSREVQKQSSISVLLGCARSTDQEGSLIFEVPQNKFLFSDEYEFAANDFEINTYQFQDQKVWSIEPKDSNRSQNQFFTNARFGFDVFETIFFHISRVEEWNLKSAQLDAHDRMKAEEMILVKNSLEKIPVVDRLVIAFFEALGFKPKTFPTKINWTHDIDIIQKFPTFKKVIFAFGNVIFKQRNIRGFFKLTSQYFDFLKTGKDPFDTFDLLLFKSDSWKDFESSHEYELASKTIYILSGGEVPKIENHFDLSNPRVIEFINLAKSRGYEIGIHPSYNSHLKKDLFKKEKEALEKLIGHDVQATRQHFLRWKFPETPRIIEEMGMKSDSTVGFADRIGFRCGTGFAYHLYDFEKERAFEFLEIPMVVMDVGLMRDAHYKQDKSYLNRFLSENSQSTLITFNFHNSTIENTLIFSSLSQILQNK